MRLTTLANFSAGGKAQGGRPAFFWPIGSFDPRDYQKKICSQTLSGLKDIARF